MEFEEDSSFPCRSTEEFHEESFSSPARYHHCPTDRIAKKISAGSEIIARIHLRRPSVPNLRKIAINRRRPTSGTFGVCTLEN